MNNSRFRVRKMDEQTFVVEKLLHQYVNGKESFDYVILETLNNGTKANQRMRDYDKLEKEYNRSVNQ